MKLDRAAFPAALFAAVALVCVPCCVRETEFDRKAREMAAKEREPAQAAAQEEDEGKDPFVQLAGTIYLAITYAKSHSADSPFHLVFDEAAKEVRLEAKDGEEVVERYEVPPELIFLNHPGKITFHRDGRVTWPVPDTTLLGEKARDATASDITVKNTKTGDLCAYDLDPGDIINFMMKDTPARR